MTDEEILVLVTRYMQRLLEVVDEMPTDSVARRQATVQAMIDFVTDAYRGIKPGKPPPIEALQWLLKDLENWD